MNKFAKTMSNTSHKLKQKAGMAEKTVDPSLEDCRGILNDLIEKASAINKAYTKQAEALEVLQPSKNMTDDYVLDLEGNTGLNTDMGGFFRLLSNATLTHLEMKKEATTSLNNHLAELKILKDRVSKRDELLVSYDKHKARLHSLGSKSNEKEIAQETQKTQQYQEAYETANTTIVEDIRKVSAKQHEVLDPSFLLIIQDQQQFFANMAHAYQSVHAV